MKELTITFDNVWINKQLEEYISLQKGVIETKINEVKEEIYIKYNTALTSINILKLEILLFMNIRQIPSIIAFNKHPKNKMNITTITIEDICCEYCFKSIIEELLIIDGIESASSEFSNDYNKLKNVIINIEYDNNLITKEKIIDIETKLNLKK